MATTPVSNRKALKGKGGLIAVAAVVVLGLWLMADMKHPAREAKDGRLFLLTTSEAGDVKDKKSADLRDKRLFGLKDTKDVTGVVLQRPTGTVELARRGEEKWDMLQPFRAPADKSTVQDTFL